MSCFREEYRRSCRFVRLKLRGFKATILDVDLEIEAYLTIHKAGFAVLSFWLFTDKGIKLEDTIKMEDPFSPFRAREIWTGFLDHIRKCKMVPEELIDKIGRGEEFTTSIEKIHNLYRSFVQSVIHDVDSCEELKKKIRYSITGISLVVAIFDVDQLDKFLHNHRKELHGMLAIEEMWDWVSEAWISDAMKKNLAWREGWHVYIGNGRALLIVSKEANDRLRERLKRKIKEKIPDIIFEMGPSELLPGLHPPYTIVFDKERIAEEELRRTWKYQLREIMLDLTTIMENLSLQEIMLRTYDYILGEKMPKSIKGLSTLKEEISKAIEEFLNVRVWKPLTAKKWIEFGKNVMGIDEMYKSIRRRLNLVESMIRTLYDKMFNWLILLLTTVSGYLQIVELAILTGFNAKCIIEVWGVCIKALGVALLVFTIFLFVFYRKIKKIS
ncbi:hypothetical protein [Candidatus Methanodesulfokora washburnensis]|uniref:hypothetical protein n=1 Tax=Candidatus Methanodesulfokora washburnensis TaxID=2478471 RepID=UPI000F770AE3|nr:hypothetical protein [Candidatus Methanodesulfokores washburnensis]